MFQVLSRVVTAVRMEELASWAVSVRAPHSSPGEAVNTTPELGKNNNIKTCYHMSLTRFTIFGS